MSSEVAEIRKQIEAEYQSAQLGLSGVAITARHDFIQARNQQIAVYHGQLVNLVGDFEAICIVAEINGKVVRRSNDSTDSASTDSNASNPPRIQSNQASNMVVSLGESPPSNGCSMGNDPRSPSLLLVETERL